MDILNLDALLPVKRVITLDGEDHEMREMDVEDFIVATAEAKRLENQTEQDAVVNIEANVKHLQSVFPTLPAGRIKKLKFVQLMALLAFTNGKVAEVGEAGKDQAGNAPKAE